MADPDPEPSTESLENHGSQVALYTITLPNVVPDIGDDDPPPYEAYIALDGEGGENHSVMDADAPPPAQAVGIRARTLSVFRKLRSNGGVVFIRIKHSMLTFLIKDRGEEEKWSGLFIALICSHIVLLGFAGFVLSGIERSELHRIHVEEPLFMYDSVRALERSSVVTMSASLMFSITGLLGCWSIAAKNRLIMMLQYAVLVVTFAPLIYHGFGEDVAYGLPEQNSHSASMRVKLSIELKKDYGVDLLCRSSGYRCTTKKWDNVQENRLCCGIYPLNADVYLFSVWYQNQTRNGSTALLRVPESCCVRTKTGGYVNLTVCQNATSQREYAGARHSTGCDIMQENSLRQMQLRLSITSLLLSLLALLLLVFTLINNIPEPRRRHLHTI